MFLTPSQTTAVELCLKLLPRFKIVVIKGETSAGKFVVATEVFRQLQAEVVHFDLCEFAENLKEELSSQSIIRYLNSLLTTVLNKMDSKSFFERGSRKRPRLNLSND